MSAAKFPHPDSSEGGNIQPNLSPEAQRDLAHALEDDEKEAWVEETRSSLMKAFALGRKVDAPPQKGIDVYTAVEGTEKDLRHTLKTIYDKHGKLAMYDRGTDSLAPHWVVGYKSARGTQTVQKVTLYVEGTEWTRSSRDLENPAARSKAEDDTARPEDEDWTVVERPIGGFGSSHFRP